MDSGKERKLQVNLLFEHTHVYITRPLLRANGGKTVEFRFACIAPSSCTGGAFLPASGKKEANMITAFSSLFTAELKRESFDAHQNAEGV